MIRASATPDGEVVGTLRRGQRIPTTAGAPQGWTQVRFRHQTAFVATAAITTRTTKVPAGADEGATPG